MGTHGAKWQGGSAAAHGGAGGVERDLHRLGSRLCPTHNKTEGTVDQRGPKGAELNLTPFSSQTHRSKILLLLAERSGWVGTERVPQREHHHPFLPLPLWSPTGTLDSPTWAAGWVTAWCY